MIDFQKSLMYEFQYRLVWLSLLVWFLLKTAGYSELSLTNSWPPVTDSPKTFTAGGARRGGHIGVPTGISKFASVIILRNTNCKGQRTQLKIRFAFCQRQSLQNIQFQNILKMKRTNSMCAKLFVWEHPQKFHLPVIKSFWYCKLPYKFIWV